MQLCAISITDLAPIATAPTHNGRLGPCLLVVDGRFILGGFDGEVWHDSDYAIVCPSRWLRLLT